MPVITQFEKEEQPNMLGNLLGLALRGYTAREKTKKKSEKDIEYRKAAAKELGIPEEELPLGMYGAEGFEKLLSKKHEYALKEQVKKKTAEEKYLTAAPIRQVGGFDPRRALPGYASYNEATKKVISNLKTKADLEELLENREEYEAEGVVVQSIIEYYQ